jgi:hypothetical protein
MRSSAHKNINNPPGQVVNKITKIDGTLQDYYERKGYDEPKKKLTFEEWWEIESNHWRIPPGEGGNSIKWFGKRLWQEAQENK